MTSKRIAKKASRALRKGGSCSPLGGSILAGLRAQRRKRKTTRKACRRGGRR